MKPTDNTPRKTHFPPTKIAVDIPDDMYKKRFRAYFYNFTVPEGTSMNVDGKELRGIANIGFINPENIDDMGIYLRVYVDPQDSEKKIYKLKEIQGGASTWHELGGEYDENEKYLIAKIELGDPPIAVG